ncbi:GntR family transcriptional regulator [Evansella sp. LMS18]|uniref:GntR family transcriptional regulator n=1 Tax=Evansella sp. LMS18 TaxID=2924033 RepID=UPI0020D0707D|nr:GntR family transcriptional regulator [Evansella sp. LMS18]UTR11918.1 GntR family transcriptional regulator [Evansella sp. LMS18]
MTYRLTTENKSTIQVHVTNKLRQAIFQGAFKKGDRLIQEEWAKKLGVSRMPIREALKQLEMEGLVKIEPRKGAVVIPISADDISEIYTVRSFFEGLAVEKALPYITENDEAELEEILLLMENLVLTDHNMDYYIGLNKQYHQKLREKCPWRRVKQQADTLWLGFLPIASPNLLKDCYKTAQNEHRLIFEAVKKRDPALVKSTVQYHVDRNKNSLISIMDNAYSKL